MTKLDSVDAYFEALDDGKRAIALALKSRIEALGEGLTVKLAWGYPCWSGQARIISIIAHKHHCNLQLWSGARLASRFAEIEGTGKGLRHVKVRGPEAVDARLDAIIAAAIDLDRTDPEPVR